MRLKKLKKKNINVNLQWEKVTEVNERLEQIKDLMLEAQQHPIFQEKLAKVKKFKQILKLHLIVILMYMLLQRCRQGNQPSSMQC